MGFNIMPFKKEKFDFPSAKRKLRNENLKLTEHEGRRK